MAREVKIKHKFIVRTERQAHGFRLACEDSSMRIRCYLITITCQVMFLLLLVGCGSSDRASVNGTITLDGKLVESGSITFFPSEGTKGPSAGATIKDGYYEINTANKGVVIGKNRIVLNANHKTGRRMPNPFDPTVMIDEVVQAFPPEYSTESKVIRDIQSGENQINLDIVSNKKIAH